MRTLFSFSYDGESSANFLDSWEAVNGDALTGYQDPRTSLTVEQRTVDYADFKVREWVLELCNCGQENTPILSDVYPLDMMVRSGGCPIFDGYAENNQGHTGFILHYAHGGMAGPDDYKPETQSIGEKGAKSFKLTTQGGRSSNLHMPFFNLQTSETSGLLIAIGWSGQWHCLFDVVEDNLCRIRAGMEHTHLHLHPGERIRTPSIVIMEWEGNLTDSYNQWRQFLSHHKCLDLGGERPLPRTWANSWFTFNCGYDVNEQNQKDTMTGAAKMGIEHLVIDAGWYKCATPFWWDGVGSWVPRDNTFPDGFSPLKEHGDQVGIRFGIWFEPERATSTSIVAQEHPEWLVGVGNQFSNAAQSVNVKHQSNLVNLGLPEVQDWFIQMVAHYVEQGMTWFRHDCNIDPLEMWKKADPPDRQGMSEIRYIEGLYRIYDEIHRRHPSLIIEGCASGGRRIDIETIKRNHGYWATDMMCGTPEPMQAHIIGFNKFLLPHWHNTVLQMKNAPKADTPANRYAFFSFLGGAPCFCFDMRDESVNFELGKKWLDWFKEHRHLTMGDFYPLTEWSLSQDVWMGYQFHRKDLEEGLVVVFRRPGSPYSSATFPLAGLDPRNDYLFRDIFSQQELNLAGTELLEGFQVTLTNKPDIAVYQFRRQ